MKVFLALIISFGTTVLQAKSLGEKYHESTKARVDSLTRLQKDIIFEEKICPGDDLACAVRNIKTKRIRSTAELYGGIQILTGLYQKKLKKSGNCQEVCRTNLNALFIEQALELLEDVTLKEFLIVEENDTLESRLIRYGEELALFKLLRRVGDKLLELNTKVEADKVFNGSLGNAAKAFSGRIAAVQHGQILRKGILIKLDPASSEYGLFLRTVDESGARDFEALLKAQEKL